MGDGHSAVSSSAAGATLARQFASQLRPAVLGLVVLTLVSGAAYPAMLLGVGNVVFPDEAGGSLVYRGGAVVGSRLIGQGFSRPEYFQTRPSAAGTGYDATQSSGTNLAPANPQLIQQVRQAAAAYRKLNGLVPDAPAPIDAVTSSASGLDPDISPQNADLQVARVAKARGVGEAVVRRLVAANTRGPDLGLLGAPRVSVLQLNLALDRAAPTTAR
jgi:potassium-transporting ATPase KdpC subunit